MSCQAEVHGKKKEENGDVQRSKFHGKEQQVLLKYLTVETTADYKIGVVLTTIKGARRVPWQVI